MEQAGKLDPVIGRDEEIRRVVRILSRRTKNNPVLIGEPGVGKTAVVEGWHRELLKVMYLAIFLMLNSLHWTWVHWLRAQNTEGSLRSG